MPNWIEGTLKIRGNPLRIVEFLEKGCDQPAGIYEKNPMTDFITTDEELWNEGRLRFRLYTVSIKNSPHIAGTHRAFLDDYTAYFECEDEKEATVFLPVRQAWDFKTEEWQKISEEHKLKIRLYGFESGMEFNHEIEIIEGRVTIDREIKYADYEWECPMPTLGG